MKKKLLLFCFSTFATAALAQHSVTFHIDSLLALMTSQEKIQQLAAKTLYSTAENTRLNIPGFLMQDGPHGLHKQGYTSFPTGMAMAAMWDRELVQRLGRAMGEEFWADGQHVALGPCIDITLDPRGGRTAESGGEEPYLAGQTGAAFIRGVQEVPVIACLKHFEVEGKQAYRKTCDEQICERDLMQFFGLNFRTALQEGVPLSLMSSYNLVNGVKANESRLLMTEILRQRWGYPFMVISDWAAVKDADRALVAGNDVCMGSTHYSGQLPKDLTAGVITEAQLDTAVRRVLLSKYATGMMPSLPQPEQQLVATAEHRELCREAVGRSVVLLRNDTLGGMPLLPLRKDARIALIGPNAEAENLNCFGSSETLPAASVSLLAGMKAVAPDAVITCVKGCDIADSATTGYAAAIAAAREADIVVFAGGLDNSLEGERTIESLKRTFDRDSTALPAVQQQLIRQLHAANPRLVVVMQSGGVVSLPQCADDVPALLYAFYGGQEAGLGIADVLFGDVCPSGKMPQTMPVDDTQLPEWNDIFFSDDLGGGYRWMERQGLMPLFPFGYGLSYTHFSYTNLSVAVAEDGGFPVTVSVEVTNTGACGGEEVVQLYIGVPEAADLPHKELRGYERVSLQPRETKEITFSLNAEDFYAWDEAAETYVTPAGQYTFYAGTSSDDASLLSTQLTLQPAARADLKVTGTFTYPRYPKTGDTVTFYAYVKNRGNAPAADDWAINFDVEGQRVATADAVAEALPQTAQALAPGQGALVMAKGMWTATKDGAVAVEATLGTAEDGIEEVKNDRRHNDNWAGAVYDLSGRRVESTKMRRGIYLHDGRKVVVR